MTTAVQDIEVIQQLLRLQFPQVEADGDIGRITNAALRLLKDDEVRRKIQGVLRARFPQVQPDGIFGPITYSALSALDELGDHESMADRLRFIPPPDIWNTVKASSFADPADVGAFRLCKRRGNSDLDCFKLGDNGIGKWGADCSTEITPMVALPREVWRAAGKTGGDKLLIARHNKIPYGGKPEDVAFEALLGDTMPSEENIKNGAGIDCNPAAVRKLGEKPPMMLKGVMYRWL